MTCATPAGARLVGHHAQSLYDEISPLGRRGHDASPLKDALELWGAVLSRPEADAVVVGVGRRDAPFDLQPPQPVAWRSLDGSRTGHIVGATDIRLNDQHLTLTNRYGALPQIGDLVRFTISHPCGAFDRWRVIAVINDDRLVGAVHTVF